MLKKVSAVTLMSLLAFSPVIAMAAPGETAKETIVQQQEKVPAKQNDIKNTTTVSEPKVEKEQGNVEVKKENPATVAKDEKQEEKTASKEQQQPAPEKKAEPVKNNEKEQKDEPKVESGKEQSKATNPVTQPTNQPPVHPEEKSKDSANEKNEISIADFSGNVTGKATWDAQKNHYVLDVNATVTNNSKEKVSGVYLGVSIPEGLGGDIELEDGSEAMSLPLPDMEPGKTVTKNVKIPVLGNVAGKEVNKDIGLYLLNKGRYESLGKIKGSANLDFSEMNKDLRFEGKAKATTCVPNLKENQFTLDFLLTTQNLTMDELKGFDVEIDVPKDIKLTIPDHYTQGEIPDYLKDGSLQGGTDKGTMNLDIKWNGNTATVPVKAMRAGEGSVLYFQVVGETTKDFKDLYVTLTAKRGDQTITKKLPIEKVEKADCKKKDDENTGGGNNNGDGKGNGNNNPDTNGANQNQVKNPPAPVTPTNISTTPTKVNYTKSLPKTGTSSSDNLLTLLGVVMLAGGAFVYKRSRMADSK
ncbi:LPXTG cell wall anchor domain-containing protein [Bacillus sp. DX1.1]|uniref:LPXTG cell wall anchor domain-containing protein n=1 Tax=unclassified Bacillus (in: firmicutes) TaxID=185979 RepID=UPI00256FF3DD|nr:MULTISPECIES: LPXTG cell wall anchor domain-containing protein [unclassified Bacillus (in: firmicutes)]MDM5152993.1 LPXTG cell wall anchor domain-containing protein [Bacillus sp. DX1.1]WJE81970.1 LPXTG cell wall anchor domain-containing protein [Bacillus sp. DX3.1]